MHTYYAVLEVQENAVLSEIKTAYRKLAKKYHPDLNPSEDSTEKFIAIEEAYSCLSKDDSRKSYDRLLRYKREKISRPTVQQKYQNDVNKRTSKGRTNATRQANMSYKQYQKDVLFSTSGIATLLQGIFLGVSAVLLAILYFNIALALYGPRTEDWGKEDKSIFIFAGTYVLIVIGLAYVYEPLVQKIIVGKPKNK